MATFKACIKTDKKRKDGFYQVFIRVIHNRKTAYIATDKYVNGHGLYAGEVSDPYVLQFCMSKITRWTDKLNRVDIENWTVKEVTEYVRNDENDVSFSEYARKHIDRIYNMGQERNSRNYKWALDSIESFAATDNLLFSQMTSTFLNRWIMTLEQTKRAKQLYPICMRQVFKAALLELNDEERGVERIKFNPWAKVQIPKADTPTQLAISPEECREFFSAPIPPSKMASPLPELGRDIALMVLCLGGINTVDLYNMKREDYYDGVLHYNRAKTKRSRADNAYMEMRVPPILSSVFQKYMTTEGEWLFTFHDRHSSSDSFSANVNIGIHKICESMGMKKENYYCAYTFRHTWATIAQNDCNATLSEVGFGLNHASKNRVTRGYVKLDYSPAWILNEKVIELIFFTQKKGNRSEQKENVFERFSPKYMMRGEVFYKGAKIGKIEDTGFHNVDEMIGILYNYTDDVPDRAKLLFRITNIDKQQTAIYERPK